MSDSLDFFNNLLQLAVDNKASDIHVKTDHPAHLRIHGNLEVVDMDPVDQDLIKQFVLDSCPEIFHERWIGDFQIDYSYKPEGLGRFRVNAFYQRGVPSVVFRHVNDFPPTFAELNLQPEVFQSLIQHKDGIVLLCGPTGSGKSSTLAAMLDEINHTMDKHIVTLEDPIEFNYTDDKSVFNQREIGIDAPTFAHGMKAVLRQDPDIILIGEMRDVTTFKTAITAAETGHLVFGTLHASNAQQAVQRLFEFFPADEQDGMRRQIASTLRATVTQRLVPSMDGGRVPAIEAFIIDTLGRKAIEEASFSKIPAILEAGRENGSTSFNLDLFRLFKDGMISKSDALKFSPNPKALEMNLKGIFLSSGGIVT